MCSNNKPIIVIGHKNPDTDSICSAICYADLKSKITNETYIAKRAGHLNEETQYVLKKYDIKVPEYIKDVRPQVSDIEIRRTEGVSKDISVKDAWTKMKDLNVVTLPITQKKRLIGLITIGDIAKSYFEVYDSTILATAKTKFQNIVDTLNGTVITGNINEVFQKGKVVIAAANPEMMENYIEAGDIVILGNRYEAQLCAIEMEAKCLIVCEGAGISKTITKVANERDCIIISTSYDTYTVARLINQSMPIEFLMKKKEDGLISFNTDDFIEDIQGIMAKKRHRDFPIEDNKNNYIGMISRRNLLGAGKKQIILVDHNEKGQAISGIETAQILEIIDHHRIGSIETVTPVFFRNQPLGCTATIICQMYHENNIEITPKIAYLLCSAIISDTLIFKSPTCTAEDIKACRELADIAGINIEEHGMEMFNAGSNLSSKTAKEIIMQDYKKFSVNDIKIGVGQINTMSQAEIDNIRGKIENYIDKVIADGGVDMVYLLMTNIMTESSEVVFAGKSAGSVLANAFNVQVNGKSAVLEKIVSRKKQFFPAIMETLQQ
jgi:manganese-dependent inorganic pyrophosphatase